MNHRPVLFDLNLLHYPIAAWASLFHRLSGVFLFFLIPVLLWMLQASLESEQHFLALKHYLSASWGAFLTWIALCALGVHVVAGIRHLCMDMHIGESKRGGKIGAIMVFVVSMAWIVFVALRIFLT